MLANLASQEAESRLVTPDDALAEFTREIEEGLSRWQDAMATGDTRPIEQDMAPNITCYFGRAGLDSVDVISRDGIVNGMRQSVAALRGCTKRFENRLIRMRSSDEAVVFFEQVVERESEVLARLFTIETYRRVSGRWRCLREIVEHVGR